MALALFDLDNTLIAGDSDHLWGEFLADQGVVDAEQHRVANDRFYADYQAGRLDIFAYLAFALRPLATLPEERLLTLRRTFIDTRIRPLVLPRAMALVEEHRAAGDTLVIVTATHRFVTEPIAALFDVPHLLATEPERRNRRYTGAVAGTPCYKEGKVYRLREWLHDRDDVSLRDSCFYSDSHNDLPLLEVVDRPVAVDPDDTLRAVAQAQDWPILSLR